MMTLMTISVLTWSAVIGWYGGRVNIFLPLICLVSIAGSVLIVIAFGFLMGEIK